MGSLKKWEIKKNIHKKEDRNLSFRVFDLTEEHLKEYKNPHKKDHFLIVVVENGTLQLHIESKAHFLKTGKIAVVFPEQVHFISDISHDLKGKIILFEEILFCSDILKNELSTYNVNLSTQLNCTFLSTADFKQSYQLVQSIQEIYQNLSLIKKEQARFQIKIFLQDFGISKADWDKNIDYITANALADPCTGFNPRVPILEELKAIYNACYEGAVYAEQAVIAG
ncbi:AraC family ligand binding domain-containing protein [uncultured Chryseobacterium sp.]|uniref:AraC family ligand binding domain-containing protein n=1 Tax=uncultured Chryseobacterium sp. TaxID=259322 RepID=UPI0025F38465|nr:AraC family ligand binding domain-containing protein [uncultured Chryseobacterium sp.]